MTNLILSTIDYCNILLLGATKHDLRPLRLIINRALRFIYTIYFKNSITPYYHKAHFLPIAQRIQFKASLIAFKIYNHEAPTYFNSDFIKFVPTSNMELRADCGRDAFMFKPHNDDINCRRLTSKIINNWNALPLNIRQITSRTLFKTKLKTFLFSNF